MANEPTAAAPPAPTLIHQPRSYVERLDWRDVFAIPQPLEIELGSGDGSFLLHWAGKHPARNFLGVERLKGRLRKLDRKGRRAGLANLRGLRIEAGYFIEFMVPPASVEGVHIYFPDPWPKRKHQQHRLIDDRFVEALSTALAPGGMVYLRTDDSPYFESMTLVFRHHPRFALTVFPDNLAAVQTDFEREFVARGLPIFRAAYCRRPA